MKRILTLCLVIFGIGCSGGPRPAPAAAARSWTDFRPAVIAATPDPKEMGPIVNELWEYANRRGLSRKAEQVMADCEIRAIYISTGVGVGYTNMGHQFTVGTRDLHPASADVTYLGIHNNSLRVVSNHKLSLEGDADGRTTTDYNFDLRQGQDPNSTYTLELPVPLSQRPKVAQMVKQLLSPASSEDWISLDGTGIDILVTDRPGRTEASVYIDVSLDEARREKYPNFSGFADLVSEAWHVFALQLGYDPEEPTAER
ncbi:MAG: hypothetical protein JWP03_83 [Phycisphaerales bacterium]|nr:hypothetical protein [Phycisphaerales bacterium]